MPTANFKVGEMLHKRTPNSKTWMNFDGSYTTEIHPGAVHFVDEHGNLQNINTDLYDEADFDVIDEPVSVEGVERFVQSRKEVRAAKKNNILNRSQHNFQALRVPFDVNIPRNFQRGYTIGKGVDKLTFKPVKSSPSTGELSQTDRSVIVYQDVWNDTDVELKIQPDGIKETLYLKTDKAPSSFSFEVRGKEIAADFTAGALKLMPAWLIDAAGTYRDVEQKVVQGNDNKVYVELIAPVDGLVYPVAIDPTVVIQPTAAVGKDTHIHEGAPSSNYGTQTTMGIGKDNGNKMRSLIQFDISAIPVNSDVSSAELYLRFNSGSSTGSMFTSTIHEVKGFWSESDVTWNNQPVIETSPILSHNTLNADMLLELKPIVQEWVSGGKPNYGIMIKGDESTQLSNTYRYFLTSDYNTNNTLLPKMTIVYNEKPSIPTLTAPNGGESWNAEHTVVWQASTDAEGNAIVYEGQLSTDNGATWKTIFSNVSGTSKTFNFYNEKETSTALLRLRAFDGYSYSAWDQSNGVFTIQHNQAPLAPTDLVPAGGVVDRTKVIRLAWKHNDPNVNDYQSKAEVSWRLQGAVTWNELVVNGINQYIDVNSGTFPAGGIEWRVRTYDQNGLPSPYPQAKVFTAAEPSNAPTIVQPGDVVAIARPVIEWVASDQIAYQIVVINSLNEVIWDTGEVPSTVKARTSDADLINGGAYKVSVRVKNAAGLFTSYAEKTFAVSYTPPARPEITVTESDIITLAINDPAPTGTQPVISHHEVYRRKAGETVWMRVSANTAESFTDPTTGSGVLMEYYVRAWGDNGTYQDSFTVEGTATVEHAELVLVSDNSQRVQLEYNTSTGQSKSYGRTLQRFAGRTYPMAEFSPENTLALSTDYILKDRESLNALYALLDRKETLLYRDAEGRRAFVTIGGIAEDEIGFGQLFGVSFQMDQVYVKEEV